MPRRLVLTSLLSLVPLAAAAPAASGAWFPADAIDGPNADVVSLGGIDMSRDGWGALVYIRRDGGVPHVFVSRQIGGSWRPPERVDPGVDAAATDAAIAVVDDFRMAIAWTAGGRLYGALSTGGDQPQPLGAPTLLFEHPAGKAADPAIDMGINGTAYVTYTAPGGGGTDVRAVRLQGTGWEHVGPGLDIDGNQAAGPSKVAVSAEGNAVATWTENHQDGRRRVYARRVTGLTPSAAPQELSLPHFAGGLGGHADSPDIDIEDDGSYAWVSFRQDFGGVSRSLARRLVGSRFEDAAAIDGGNASALPRIQMCGRGYGQAVVDIGGATAGAHLDDTAFSGAGRLDSLGSAAASEPIVATSERRDPNIAVAWRRDGGGGNGSVRARHRVDKKTPFEPEAELSRPEFGPVPSGEMAIAGDRLGNFAVAMIQGTPDARRLAIAAYDRPPPRPYPLGSRRYQRRKRPEFRWRPGIELWGEQRYKVSVDGQELGTESGTLFLSPRTLSEGTHSWRVTAVDQRGQATQSREAFVRVDSRKPRVRVTVSGKRKRGRALKVSVRARDTRGSGVRSVQVRYGDGGRTSLRRSVHRYGRGKYTLTVRVSDRAGNVTRKRVRLRIRR
jgi:hypothetical protein